mmetsp:Transcript_28074/g.46650  ORF Transcript_28074/g.46650 Transcript_28074/m.46650 type:complete len:213 (-) Transcript_28074:1231-1869(-)
MTRTRGKIVIVIETDATATATVTATATAESETAGSATETGEIVTVIVTETETGEIANGIANVTAIAGIIGQTGMRLPTRMPMECWPRAAARLCVVMATRSLGLTASSLLRISIPPSIRPTRSLGCRPAQCLCRQRLRWAVRSLRSWRTNVPELRRFLVPWLSVGLLPRPSVLPPRQSLTTLQRRQLQRTSQSKSRRASLRTRHLTWRRSRRR